MAWTGPQNALTTVIGICHILKIKKLPLRTGQKSGGLGRMIFRLHATADVILRFVLTDFD